ncbi:adenosylcobinamide amidohydrolase [Microtetraspora sp. AC03309]|uniref:adenosylcobinamide amidohydrolase n=1 Tax=Microtetraspora sp. AC03309 TaxID=2779376 RepID=UPI0035B28E99|nr:adenosylcobinamide amidohydrolase [Microtetraspora sp. AC03309]
MTLGYRDEDGARLASLLWEFGPGWRMISSAMLGGGIGPREWVLNAQVIAAYARMDPLDHLAELGPEGAGPGVGMLTAASVDRYVLASDGGVDAVATVGLRVPTWAASPEGRPDPELRPALLDPVPPAVPAPGTINIVVAVPVAFTDAALVNAVMTVTEAKTQALIEAGFQCTGTASDAVCVAVRDTGAGGRPGDGTGDGTVDGTVDGTGELFGGPRSTWGARIARAVHRAVLAGAEQWTATHLG